MALKSKLAEVKHLLINGVPEEMNALVASYINDSWKILEAKLVNFDAQNRLLTVMYIFVRYPDGD